MDLPQSPLLRPICRWARGQGHQAEDGTEPVLRGVCKDSDNSVKDLFAQPAKNLNRQQQ